MLLTQAIESLLREYAINTLAQTTLSRDIALASMKENHLYEDMGFHSRKDYELFMNEHYPLLAQKKPQGVRWKKFLFDSIGAVAPACSHCPDTDECFSCPSA